MKSVPVRGPFYTGLSTCVSLPQMVDAKVLSRMKTVSILHKDNGVLVSDCLLRKTSLKARNRIKAK